MKIRLACGLGLAAFTGYGVGAGSPLPYQDPRRPVEERVDDLLSRMTVLERDSMLAGQGWMESRAIPRLGIPSIKMADGPLGVRNWTGPSSVTMQEPHRVTTTAFPSGIALASSWDPVLAGRVAQALGQEVKAFGRDMILGPTVNINRVPLWGRNFEGFGEDPYLAARLAVAWVKGVQSEGVIPAVKHFDANNEEFERHRIDEQIDARTLHEIYMPAFKAAVTEAGAWAVMSAYNKVNGQWCSENPYLLRDTLQRRWGFRGFVISDWGSTYSTPGPINAGMNLEMPGGAPFHYWFALPSTRQSGNSGGWLEAPKVMAAVKSGEVSQERVDDSVRRILRVMFTAGLFDHPHRGGGLVDTPPQRAVARRAAEEGVVLLKNDNQVLPWIASGMHAVAVIGPSAEVARTGGGGSSYVQPKYAISVLQGVREAAGRDVHVIYALGAPMAGAKNAQQPSEERLAELRKEAAAVAAQCDAAVVVVGDSNIQESEGFDRTTMQLPAGQEELIAAVAAANPRTVVVVIAGSPVATASWLGQVPGVLCSWFSGQEGGRAIGEALFGQINPSGKLPVTWPKRYEDSTAYAHYPGVNLHVTYAEGIYVGYRGFDKRGIEPLFPFGYGLSYTTFAYSGLHVVPSAEGATVTFTVRNTGERPGAEVAELYVHQPHPRIDRPLKELKGFRRIVLAPGESKTVTLSLNRADLSYFDPVKNDWVADPGEFDVWVGSSSADIRLRGEFNYEAMAGR